MSVQIEFSIRDPHDDQTLFTQVYTALESITDATPTAIAQATSRALTIICAAFATDVGTAFNSQFARKSVP